MREVKVFERRESERVRERETTAEGPLRPLNRTEGARGI
jgi:hypothetical protein